MNLHRTPDMATAAAEAPAAPAATDDAHRRRRERFLEKIGGGVAVVCAGPQLIRSRDTEVKYRVNSDFHYLTGFHEPDSVAVLTPHDDGARFTLFVRPRDPEKERWDGPRAGVEGAAERYGADAAHPLSELDDRLKGLLEEGDAIWYALGSDEAMDRRVTELVRLWRLKSARTGKGPVDVRDPGGVLDVLRRIKEPGELDALRAACRLSARGHLNAIRAARPGVGEWELQAIVDGTFLAAAPGAGPAFETIVGSGANGTVLHYVVNRRRTEDGDLVLIDAGAELGMYAGDITRTWPVSGRFTPAQRAVYDVVLASLEAAIAECRPGAGFSAGHEAARRVLTQGMVDLGLLSGSVDGLIESEDFKRFFMHQTSHWLGLDVHDAGPYRDAGRDWCALEPGMVLTVEPGLYIAPELDDVPPELRGIGIRIEDDVLVTEHGPEILTRDVPVDPDALAALVGTGAEVRARFG